MQDPSLEDALDTTMADRMADLAALGFGRKPQGNARGSLNFAQRDQIRREDKGYRDGFRNIIGEKDGLGGWAADAIPGIGAGAQIADMNRLLHAAEAYNAGTANQAQVDLAVNFYDQNQREGGFMSGVGELASGSIQMLPSLLTATALVSASGKAITGAVAKKTLEKMMKSMAERGMVANVATGMAARGAVGALGNEALSLFTRPFGGRGAIERSAFEMDMAERMNISADEAGELFITLSGASKNLVKHLPKAIFSEMVELGTEQMGGAINYAKTLTPEGAALSFLGREYTKLVGVVGKSKAAKKINAAFGVDDILTEYGEELVAAGTRDVAAVLSGGYLADGGNIESLFEPENLAIMLGGVGHMNLAMRSTSNVVGGTFEKFAESDRKKREAKDAEEIAEEESERSDSKPTTGLPDDPGAENTDTTDEGASGTQPVVGPTWTPEERARDVARLRESNSPFGGDDTLAPLTLAQEREPDISDEVSWIRKTAEKLGINVQFVTRNWTKEQHEAEEADIAARRAAGEDVETRHTGVFVGEGRIIIDIDSFDAIGLMFHESTHHLEKVDKAAFDRLYELMMQLDPEGMAAAEAAQREAGGEMNKGEFAAVRAEQLANVLTALQSDAKMTRIRRVLRDKGGRSALKKVFEVVIDMLAMVDAKHFGEIDTARKRMNDALSAIGDPNGTRTDLEVAMAVHDAMRGMREVFDASASTTRRRDRRQARDTARQERSEERAAAQADAEGTAASAAAARARTEQAISDAQAAIERDPANQKAVTEQAIADVIALMDEAARAESKQETLDAIEAAEEAIQAQITGTERQITLAAIDKARADIEAAPAEAAKAETLSAIADAQEAIGAAVAAARADEARTHVEATAKTEAREQKSTRGAEKERKRRERAAKRGESKTRRGRKESQEAADQAQRELDTEAAYQERDDLEKEIQARGRKSVKATKAAENRAKVEARRAERKAPPKEVESPDSFPSLDDIKALKVAVANASEGVDVAEDAEYDRQQDKRHAHNEQQLKDGTRDEFDDFEHSPELETALDLEAQASYDYIQAIQDRKDGLKAKREAKAEAARKAAEWNPKFRYAKAMPLKSPAFKRWFKDSKVVDADGKPLVVYHGTGEPGHTVFDSNGKRTRNGAVFGAGTYFAEDDRTANRYAGEDGGVYPVYLSIQNPFILGRSAFSPEAIQHARDKMEDIGHRPDIIERTLGQISNGPTGSGPIRPSTFTEMYRMDGYDGAYLDGIWIAFNPTQIKSATGNRGTFDANDPDIRHAKALRHNLGKRATGVMSTSLPMGPNILHDPDEFHLMVTMDPTKEQLENRYYIAWRAKVAKYIRTLDLIKNKEADDEAVFKEFKKNIVSNLLALYKHGDVHEWREEAKLWYDGGNKVSRTWARRFKVSRFQIAGIIAAFSPQTEWFTNLGRAEFLGRAMSDKKILNHKFDAAQVAWGKVVIEKKKDGVKYYEARILPKMLRKIKGQSLKQLLKAGEISMAARAVRSYAEVYTNRRYTGWKPSGARMASVKTDKGEYGTLAWGGYGDIKKAIRMFQDGSDQSLSKNLGDAHKVRSFYNNIAHPDAPWGDVTMDTHAVAAGFWAPFSGSSKEVSANLTGSVAGGGGPGATKPHGMIGLYPIMADAYRTAAKRVGIQPREMQSITWEAIRGLFSADFKAEETKMEKAKKGSSLIRPVWKQYQDGKLTLAQARAKVYRLADGITAPKWHTDGLGTSGGGAAAGDVGSPGPGRARKSGKRSSGAGAKPARGDNAARSDTRGKSSRVKPRFAKAMPLKSPKFRRWFKDSAVVDEKGKPLVLYHGSPDPGTYPDPDRVLWGSRNEHHAWAYARAPRGTSRKEVHQAGEGISPVYMSIQAPFYSDALRENVSVDEFFDEMVKQGIATAEELKDYRDIVLDGADRLAPKWDRSHMSELMQRQPEPVMQYKVFQFWHNPEAVLGAEGADTLFAAMEKAGFDGIYHRELGNDTWGALGGIGRVKSATGNSGAWDETKPDTRHAKAMPPKSPEFKRWFKKSEAVQPDGKPLVVAHATNAKDDFEEFRTAGLGAHFGDAGAAAARQKQLTEFSERAVGRDAGTFRTITGYLSIQNALEMPDLAGVYQTSSGELIDADEVDERIDEFDTETPRPMAWEDETDFSEWLYINDHIDQEEFFEVQYDVDAAVALLKEQGYDGIKYENAVENPGSTTWIPFGSSQFKSTENSGEFSSETGKFRFAKAMPLKSPEFKRWFDESAAALPDGKPLPLYHGTTHAYTKYNDERGNVENYLGRGFYATTDPWDASHNYADPETSPDLTSRVELRTEEIWNDVGWFGDESDAEEQARAELMGGSPSVMQVYMSIQNPADLRPGGTTLTFDEKYDEELEEYVGEPTGTLVEFADALTQVAADQWDGQEGLQDLGTQFRSWLHGHFSDGAELGQVAAQLKRNSPLSGHQNEEGQMDVGDLFGQALQQSGYDGIRHKADIFPGMAADPNAEHWIAFKDTQIKSVTGNSGAYGVDEGDMRFSKDRVPEMEAAAGELKAGDTSAREKLQGLIDRHKPVRPYTSVPIPVTDDEMQSSLTSAQVPRIGVPSEVLEEGDRVGLRLDIPAFYKHGVWVPSIHEGKGALKSVGYEPTAMITNAVLGLSEAKALAIASGLKKRPDFMIKGDWVPTTTEASVALAEEALNSPDWAQVGMDPTRHSYFYDRKTQEPIVAAERVVQVGALVLAEKPTYAPREDFKFAKAMPPKSPAHKRWFKKSKVADLGGVAKKVYRGTLKPEHQTGKGRVWPLSFSESSDISSIYSSTPNMGGANFETGASVGEYYLSIQKPLELGSGEGDMLLSELLADLEFTNRDPKVEGITDEEIQKVFNYLINRQTGKVKAGRFKYEIDDYEGDYEAELSFLSPRSDLHEMRDMIEYGSGYDEIMGIAEDLRVDTFALADTPTVMRVAKRLGYDGFVHRDQFAGVEAGRPLLGKHDIEGIEYNLSGFRDGGYEDQHLTWRPFSADQVRSVTGRRHAKDMGGGSRKGRTKKVLKEQDIVMELKLSELGLMDRLNRGFADKYLPIKKLQEELLKINPELPPDQMVETIVRLMAGKIARRSELIENLYEKPIIALAREHGLDYDELNLYIYAKHVKEGNEWLEEQAKQTERHLEAAEMAKLNGDKLEQKKQEKLAKAIGVKPGATVGMDTEIALGEVREYEKANPVALEIAKLVQKMNVESREGMVRDGLISQETADMWAGLFDWYVPTKTAQDGKSDFARSVGLSVPGADVMRRRGRTTIPDNVISMSLNQAQHMARRGETNQVGRALYKVLDQNGLIASKEEWSERHTQDGLTEEELVLKFDGVDHVIVLTDKDLADAMKHLNQAQMGKITTQIVKAMRMWSSLITQFSPGFMATNMPRDIQAALVTSLDVDQEGLQMRIAKNVRGAAAASWRVERGKPRKNEMDDWVIEFRDEGGMTGWSYNHGFAETDKDIQQRIQAGKPGQFVRGMFEYLGDINSALEGATRVSVYKALREGGMSKPEAAKYAREVTVDFNRGGEHSRTMNTAFLFFNAGVQGNLRFARAVASSSKVQAMVMGMIFGGGLQDEWLRNSAPKDKFGNNTYDQIPDYVKDHNWIIWNPFTESYLKIPMPYAYNLPLVIGRRMNAVRRDAMTEGEAFGAIFKAGLETFSPWQGANLYQAFTPSLLRPISEAAMNENFAGIPISRTKYPGQSTADSHSGRESTMAPWKMVAQAMNAVSGGDEWDSGWLDFSPESYAHVAEQFVGGFGKFIVRTGKATANIAQGRDVRMNDMPVVRRYFGERTPFGASATFYDIRDELSQSKKRITDLEERGEKKLAREWKRHDRALLSLDARWKATNKTVRKLRQERDNVDGYDKKKSLTDRIDRAMARFKREADKRILTP